MISKGKPIAFRSAMIFLSLLWRIDYFHGEDISFSIKGSHPYQSPGINDTQAEGYSETPLEAVEKRKRWMKERGPSKLTL